MKKATHKAEKGVIELEFDLIDNHLTNVKITGDFFIYPEEALDKIEEMMNGIEATEVKIREQFTILYQDMKIVSPGLTIENWIEFFLKTITT